MPESEVITSCGKVQKASHAATHYAEWGRMDHICIQLGTHEGEHMCLCGERWETK
jgi:hypothetical protein